MKSADAYKKRALSVTTLKLYQDDVTHFLNHGGQIPASPKMVANYLAKFSTRYAYATLCRQVESINYAHLKKGLRSPTVSQHVKHTLLGIKNTEGCTQRKVEPILAKQLHQMVGSLKGITGKRDKALLLVGFATGLKRQELVSLNIEDVLLTTKGILLKVRHSPTVDGTFRHVAIAYGNKPCPVKALISWIKCADIVEGALFRSVHKSGVVLGRLSPQSVALIVKLHAVKAGIDPAKVSSHSLRTGIVTSVALSGGSTWSMCKHLALTGKSVEKNIRVDPFDVCP